ncbi:MAG: hypothetical protein ACI9H6_000786 [Patiriisocius sp.]|jgi:hypothetical protein
MYFFNNDVAIEAFVKYGFPIFIIYPLGIAKVLGLLVIWIKKVHALMLLGK